MKIKFLLFFSFIMNIPVQGSSQYAINGNFPLLKNQTIRLMGFNGIGIYTIDSTQVLETGSFILHYTDKDMGMGYISAADNKPYFAVLEKQTIKLKGENLAIPQSISVVKGLENKVFVNYANEHTKREQTLSAWEYLEKVYHSDTLFLSQKLIKKSINAEINRIEKQDLSFLSKIPSTSYIHWYLPIRKLISSVSKVAQYRTREIPAVITSFRKIDYADSRMYKSGLLKDALESQYWLLENSGLPLDSVFKEMNVSTEMILKSVAGNEKLYNELANFLFDYFEKHSLYNPVSYLSLKVLTQNKVQLRSDLAKKLESYRAMRVGNMAADILFTGELLQNGMTSSRAPTRLSEITAKYKVLIFGASWCNACSEEMSQLFPLYAKWKLKGLEVVFVSLDTVKTDFQNYTNVMPFISYCDYKQWNSKPALDYYVSSSPTIYVLDQNNKIILRTTLIKAVDSWVDYKI